jgi:hypothetical protein
MSALYNAVKNNWTEVVRELLRIGAGGIDNPSILHQAVLNGNLECARILLQHGANVNTNDPLGAAILGVIAANRVQDPEMVKMLLEHGAEVEPYMYFYTLDNVETLRMLLEHSSIEDRMCLYNEMSCAISYGFTHAALLMLEYGTDPRHPMVFNVIVERNYLNGMRFLASIGVDFRNPKLMAIVRHNGTPEMRSLVDSIVRHKSATVIQKFYRRFSVFKKTSNPHHPWGRALIRARALRYTKQ